MAFLTDPNFLDAVIAVHENNPMPVIHYLGLDNLAAGIINACDAEGNLLPEADRKSQLENLAFEGITKAVSENQPPMPVSSEDAMDIDLTECVEDDMLEFIEEDDLPEFDEDGQ